MKYAYIRVSTQEQNFARQVEAIRNYAPDLRDEDIFADKESGKDFNRTNYMRLKETVQAGDEVIVKELDRFGRNKEEDKKEIEWFKRQGVCLRILDIPSTLIDFQGQEWIRDMVNNILIEVLSSFAEQERAKIKTRQREGIEAMPVVNGKRVSAKAGKAGRGFGPVPKEVNGFEELLEEWRNGKRTVAECCNMLGVSRAWWYRKVKA
ncbi:MAG: recombinase family protein [Clostridia bacterium]|nr:recombinase family protein [Clostridia bacterium]